MSIEQMSPENLGSTPRETPVVGDQIRVDITTDFYSNIGVNGPEGYKEDVEVYRSKDGEFQAIIEKRGKKIVGSSFSQPVDAVERVLHTLNSLSENKQDVWNVDYSK